MNRPAETGGGTVTAERAVLDAAHDTFEDYAQTFTNTADPLGAAHDSIVSGAGELADKVQTGVAQFLLGWNEAFAASSETCAIIAGNVGNYWLDLSDTDVDATVTIDLTSAAG